MKVIHLPGRRRRLTKEEEERFLHRLDQKYLSHLNDLKQLKLIPYDSMTHLYLTKKKRKRRKQ